MIGFSTEFKKERQDILSDDYRLIFLDYTPKKSVQKLDTH
jgi:hypothetical protein